jgi:DNA helicase-2/ATP-dependent DNA helicase PcrA
MFVDPRELLYGLDAEQRDAVTCPASATIIHAGAGSGKTRVLTNRIAYRVATGSAEAENVLAITFTREAASEMRRRLKALGVGNAPTVGTFHAVALALLRQRLVDLHQPVPNIVHNRQALVVAAAGSNPLAERPRDLLVEIDWAHARMVPPADYVATVKRSQRYLPGPVGDIANIYKEYETLKKRRQVIDLDDLITHVVHDMGNDPNFADAVRWRFRHLFVDEAQDMNPLQFALFEAIRGGRSDVFVVGDPLQAIYGWNGADRKIFDSLPDVITQATILKLPNNYRCSPQIIEVARQVVQRTNEPVHIRATRDDGPAVRLIECADAATETAAIAAALWEYAPTGGAQPWQSCAVLVRTNNQIAPILLALTKANIPVRTSRPSSDITAARAIAAQCKGRHGLTTWAADTLNESLDEAERQVAEQVRQFLHLDQPGAVDGRAFSAWISATSLNPVNTHGVEVLTFHSAKGREWHCVVIAGAEVLLLPHASANTTEQRNEEIRLAYVALTRAEHRLFISYANSRNGRLTGISPLFVDLPTTDNTSTPEFILTPIAHRIAGPVLRDELVKWRSMRARQLKQLPTVVCSDRELLRIEQTLPANVAGLAEIVGVLTAKQLASELLPIIEGFRNAMSEPI